MKINETTRFPHPVLSSFTGDYKAGAFSLEVQTIETPSTGKLILEYKKVLTEENISDLLSKNRAMMGIFVVCLETFYNKLIPLNLAEKQIEFPAGTLKGRVILRPIIWTSEEIENFKSRNMHEEFLATDWSLPKGTVLALGPEMIVHVGHEKLAPMETIFTLSQSPDIPEGEFRLQLDGEKISIQTAPGTYRKAYRLRGNAEGRAFLLNGLYLPVVMEVISCLKDGTTAYQDKKWFRIFNAKCEHLNISYTGDIFESAQKLLKSPFNKVEVKEDVAA